MSMKRLVLMSLLLVCFIYQSTASPQNTTSKVEWSSFNVGFGTLVSENSAVQSAIGQAFVGSMEQDNTRIESGVLAHPLFAGVITSVHEDQEQNIPSTYELKQNYPNPFNPGTTIEFALPKSSQVMLKIFDMLGREVATLVNETLPAGVHKVNFDARTLPSGVYFYQMGAEQFSQTKRLLLLK